MSITHPCFSAPFSEWVLDGDGELQIFAVDGYFDRIAWETMVAPGLPCASGSSSSSS
jgi:hypothetical protein